MLTLRAYDYALIRVVPRVEREEFINVGVILSCEESRLLVARIETDDQRLSMLDPHLDLEWLHVHLSAIPLICKGGKDAGPIGQMPQRARFHWLTAKRSSIIQFSPVHMGRCEEPELAVEHLLEMMVRTRGRRQPAGFQRVTREST